MSHELNPNNTVSVIAYSLHEFAYELCELGAKGFTVSLENDKLPTGGFTSYYTAILVPRHGYRIDIEGNHINLPNLPDSTPETSTETPLKAPTSDVVNTKATPLATEPKTTRTAAKKTT